MFAKLIITMSSSNLRELWMFLKHLDRLVIVFANHIAQSVTNYILLSDRIILVQFNSKPFVTNVIHVYVTTVSSSEDDIEFIRILMMLQVLSKLERIA